MSAFWSPALRWLERYFEESICAVLAIGLSALIFTQVVMRYAFDSPLTWIDEISIYCMIWMVYIGASLAVRERAHIRVFSLLFVLPRRWASVLLVASDAIWLAFNLLMIWEGSVLVQSMWRQPFTSPALGIPQKWPYLAVAVGFALMTLRLGQIYFHWIFRHRSPFATGPLDEAASIH